MKYLIKKSPDGFIKSINEEISSILNRNFDNFFPEFIYKEEGLDKYAMPVELHEKDSEYCVKAELPGIKKENLDIDIDKNHITINAKKKEEKKEDTKAFRKSEFRYGEFLRTVYFPMEIDVDNTKAKLEHGVLSIVAPKMYKEEKNSKKLFIE